MPRLSDASAAVLAHQPRSFVLCESRSRTCVIEDQSHDDRVPQLAGLTAIVALEPTFLNEPEPLVEVSTVPIVRPDLKSDLVHLIRSSPGDDLIEQRRSYATPSVALRDGHPKIGSSATPVRVRLANDLSEILHDESNRVFVFQV
jgi:hypothetical protein